MSWLPGALFLIGLMPRLGLLAYTLKLHPLGLDV
jgi:hypothetical protein